MLSTINNFFYHPNVLGKIFVFHLKKNRKERNLGLKEKILSSNYVSLINLNEIDTSSSL